MLHIQERHRRLLLLVHLNLSRLRGPSPLYKLLQHTGLPQLAPVATPPLLTLHAPPVLHRWTTPLYVIHPPLHVRPHAQAAQSASSVCSSAAASATAALQPLRDHHAITPNVLGALHTRERQLLTVMTLRQDLEDKRARLSAAQLMPASQAKRVSLGGVSGGGGGGWCFASVQLGSPPFVCGGEVSGVMCGRNQAKLEASMVRMMHMQVLQRNL
jgi:hypothetical protein